MKDIRDHEDLSTRQIMNWLAIDVATTTDAELQQESEESCNRRHEVDPPLLHGGHLGDGEEFREWRSHMDRTVIP